MSNDKKLHTYVYVEQKSVDEQQGIEVYTMQGACSDEFFLRVYMMLQCVYSERMIPCKSLPIQTDNGRMFICFVTHCGFSTIAKRFLMKIPMEHRLKKEF